jgi:ribosomal protein S18 acetylase RimI-like enzyme
MTTSGQAALRIRDARSEELDDVARLILAANQEYEPLFPPHAWGVYERDITDVRGRLGDSELIVAEDDGQILGAVTFYANGADSGERWPHGWAGIRLLAVHPDGRRRGIGRALMDECLLRCRQRGILTLGLHTTEIMSIARSMYERMGFVPRPEFDISAGPSMVIIAYSLDLAQES